MQRYLRIGTAGEVRQRTERLMLSTSSQYGKKRPQDEKYRSEERREGTEKQSHTYRSLWKNLQRRQMLGKKFRRQYSIGRYIVDFFCLECDISVELDGAPHFRELRAEYEAERTAFLQGLGIELIRFENRTVHQNIQAVLETIREAIR